MTEKSKINKIGNDPRGITGRFLGIRHSTDMDSGAKYRALRTLATKANDHVAEIDFFASEIISRRYWSDLPFGTGSTRYWLGLLYEVFSDFGRSLTRPIAGWILVQLIAVAVFLLASYGSIPAASVAIRSNSFACVSGEGSRFSEATFIAISNGTVIGNIDQNRLNLANDCLYGKPVINKAKPQLPKVPTISAIFCILQSLVSALFMFLIGLSVRNYLRVK